MYEVLKEIAYDAAPLFKEGYHAAKSITYKSAIDLVTEYDVRVEEFLKGRLHDAFPEHTLVGEETHGKELDPKYAIYIDPVDGTTNFVHGIPFCAISIGIWEDGVAVAGVVYNPILDELFYAEAGKGATLNGAKLQIGTSESLERSLVATGFPYTKIEEGEDFRWVMHSMEAILPHTRDIRRLGSAAIDLCYVARGSFDGYYEINLKPWDVGAGILMVQEAGGIVSNGKGKGYTIGDRVVVAGNRTVQDLLFKKLPVDSPA